MTLALCECQQQSRTAREYKYWGLVLTRCIELLTSTHFCLSGKDTQGATAGRWDFQETATPSRTDSTTRTRRIDDRHAPDSSIQLLSVCLTMLISSLVLALAGLATASTSDARGIPRSQKRSRARANEAITFDARSIQARAPPAGWSLFVAPNNDGGGCYQDFGSPRVLTGWSGYFGTSSIEKAITECKGRGFDWVGVEYGGEVYVGCACSTLTADDH